MSLKAWTLRDILLVAYACSTWYINFLDKANLNSAYVSGMMEDLNFKGNQFNYIAVIIRVTYVLAMLPSAVLARIINLRYFLGLSQFVWGLITLFTYKVTSVQQLYVIRCIQAIAECATLPCLVQIFSQLYVDNRVIGKRIALVACAGMAGSMSSGIFQAALYAGLNGRNGIAGWRWLFIVDGCISLFNAFICLLFLPRDASLQASLSLKPSLLQSIGHHKKHRDSEEDEVAETGEVAESEESDKDKTAMPVIESSEEVVKRMSYAFIVQSWQRLWNSVLIQKLIEGVKMPIWHIMIALECFGAMTETIDLNSIMSLYMKSLAKKHGWNVQQINHYPLGVIGVGMAATLILGAFGDRFGHRIWCFIVSGIACIIATSMLLVNRSNTLNFVGFYINGITYSFQPMSYIWVCENIEDDTIRMLLLFNMNMFVSVVTAFAGVVFWPVSKAPYWAKGYTANLVAGCLVLATTFVIMGYNYYKRQKKTTQPFNSID